MGTYRIGLVRNEDDETIPKNMIDVQDEFGNSYGPFNSILQAKKFMQDEKEAQWELFGNKVIIGF